jgi:hypothetical protein
MPPHDDWHTFLHRFGAASDEPWREDEQTLILPSPASP